MLPEPAKGTEMLEMHACSYDEGGVLGATLLRFCIPVGDRMPLYSILEIYSRQWIERAQLYLEDEPQRLIALKPRSPQSAR